MRRTIIRGYGPSGLSEIADENGWIKTNHGFKSFAGLHFGLEREKRFTILNKEPNDNSEEYEDCIVFVTNNDNDYWFIIEGKIPSKIDITSELPVMLGGHLLDEEKQNPCHNYYSVMIKRN